jgi:hypothetical protein
MYNFNSINKTFQFGKRHRGKTFAEVAVKDGGYIEWCINKITEFDITDEVLTEIVQIIENYYNSGSFKEFFTQGYIFEQKGKVDFGDGDIREFEWRIPGGRMDVEKCRQLLKKKFNR